MEEATETRTFCDSNGSVSILSQEAAILSMHQPPVVAAIGTDVVSPVVGLSALCNAIRMSSNVNGMV